MIDNAAGKWSRLNGGKKVPDRHKISTAQEVRLCARTAPPAISNVLHGLRERG